jgi:acetyl esterase/lipase
MRTPWFRGSCGAALAALLLLGSGCSTSSPPSAQAPPATPAPPATQPAPRAVTFEQFKKVLSPRSAVYPLAGGEASLMLLRLPTDAYVKAYRLDHATRALAVVHDAGRNISGLERDHAQTGYYLLIDAHGDENTQIYRLDPRTGATSKVFGHEGFQARLEDFSMDGRRLYVMSNHARKDTYRAYRVDARTGAAQPLTDGTVSFDGALVNERETHLALVRMLGNNEQQIYLTRLGSKARAPAPFLVRPSTIYAPSFFHPTEPYLYFDSDHQSDRVGCARVPLDAPAKLEWIRADPAKDIECGYHRAPRVTRATEHFDGRFVDRFHADVFGKDLTPPLPDKTMLSALGFVPGTRQVVAKVTSADDPGDLHLLDLAAGSTTPSRQVSSFNQSGLPKTAFAQSFDLRYPSFDGMSIHAVIYAKDEWMQGPGPGQAPQRHPLIVWPHGGPDGHEMHVFHPLFQFWALNGYVVFAPNFRGSDGYGKKFETLNDRDWGGGHIKDVVWGKRAIAKLPYVDPDRIYIVGASFGGFATLSTITQYPHEFRAAVAVVALANLFTFMKSIPPDPAWQSEFLREIGDPVQDKALYQERSPYFHADRIRVPLKIYQAENDVRTVKAEMDDFVARLKALKIPVEYEVLEKEGHGLARTSSWEKVLQGTLDFLERTDRRSP